MFNELNIRCAGCGRNASIMPTEAITVDERTLEEYALEFRDVSLHVGEKTVLSHVSFAVRQGTLHGILGSRRSGKTALFNLICNLDEPSDGHVLIQGRNLEFESGKLKKILGIVPSFNAFYEELSIYDNLAFFGSLYGLRKRELKENIEETLNFTQLQTRMDIPAGKLPPGLQRRLNLACAILHKPFLLVLDDPMQDLDEQHREFMTHLCLNLSHSQGVTLVYIGDYQPELEQALDSVILLHEGKILAHDTVANLVKELEGGLIRITLDSMSTETFELIEKAPFVTDTILTENSLVLKTSNAQQALMAVMHLLQNSNTDVREIKVLNPNFESVFAHMTWGREPLARQTL